MVIVGGGQTGMSLAYWLGRKGIGQVQAIDSAEPGQAGIWRTIAHMRQLNTAKTAPGPAQADAALSFQAWYEGLHGARAFEALERAPRLAWADYLAWFQQVGAAWNAALSALSEADFDAVRQWDGTTLTLAKLIVEIYEHDIQHAAQLEYLRQLYQAESA